MVVAEREVVVVCGEKMSLGITVWDMETGEVLLRIPTCASPPHGLLCLRNQFLIASQLQKDRPFGSGAIFLWPLNKPQAPLRSYPMEAIRPIASSSDGIYLVGGAPSGNAYIWEVTSGRLVKNWHAHHRPLSCLAFSHDDSFLISGSEDGVVCVWSMIRGSITALTFSLGGLWLISASKDCTACLWDVASWQVIRRFTYGKGHITNLSVIRQSSLTVIENRRNCLRARVSLLDKTPQLNVAQEGILTLLPVYCSQEEHLATTNFRSSGLLNQLILGSEHGRTPEAIQMRVEASVENRLWIIAMTKHLNTINQHLQSQLLDMIQHRLCRDDTEVARPSRRKEKLRLMILRKRQSLLSEETGDMHC